MLLRKQIDFYKRARDDIALVVEAESHRYIVRTASGRFAHREQLAVQSLQLIHLIVVWSLEVCRCNAIEVLVVAFRHIGTEEEAVVLSNRSQRLTHRYIIALLHHEVLDVTTYRSRNRYPTLGLILGQSLVRQAGILVLLLNGQIFLLRYNLILYQTFGTFVLRLGCFVSDAGTLSRVAILKL